MGTRGFIVYRVRGRYYVIYNHWDSYPTALGHSIISEIPEDPEMFEAWKRGQIAHFREEEARILRLASEEPDRENNDEDYWGYSVMPSRSCPFNNLFIEWIYVIDLDLNIFRVSDRNFTEPDTEGVQYFRLENIPRTLFTHDAIASTGLAYPVMSDSIPDEHFAVDPAEIPAPSPSLITLYASLAPTPTPTFTVPTTRRNPVWHNLHLRILNAFVPYYVESFCDAVPSLTSSPYVFRQLAYAILSLTSTPGLKFHRAPLVLTHPELRTPSWEPPAEDTYWLGDILIVLNPHIATTPSGAPSASTKASIALASELAEETPTIAVLFSVHAIMLVNIAPEGITHTPILPLFTLDDTEPPFTDDALKVLDAIGYETPGVLALLALFAAHPRVKLVPGGVPGPFPAELWRTIVGFASEEVLTALEGTCRVFRELVKEYPRLGGMTLVGWKGDGWELAGGGIGNVLSVDEDKDEDEGEVGELGWEVSAWGREKIYIGMPLIDVVWEESGGKRWRGGYCFEHFAL